MKILLRLPIDDFSGNISLIKCIHERGVQVYYLKPTHVRKTGRLIFAEQLLSSMSRFQVCGYRACLTLVVRAEKVKVGYIKRFIYFFMIGTHMGLLLLS